MARDEEVHAVGMRRAAMAKSLRGNLSDLLLLADLSGLKSLLSNDTPTYRADMVSELVAFLRERPIYGRASVVSPSGTVIASVARNGTEPWVVPADALEHLDVESGLHVAADGDAGTLLVSAMELVAEGSAAASVPEPVMRLGIALRTDSGAMAGTLVLDVLGDAVLQTLAEAHPEQASTSVLLDQNGYWILGHNPGLGSSSTLTGSRDAGFQYSFPAEWQRIAADGAGQFESGNGLFTYAAIYLGAELRIAARSLASGYDTDLAPTGAEDRWTIVSILPVAGLLRTTLTGLTGLLVSDGFGLLATGFGSWILAQWMLRSKELRHRVESENRLLSSTLGRYLPQGVSARMLRDPSRYAKLGGEMQHVAVLFADIRGFTSFSETRSPDVVVVALNHALTELTSPILRHRGILDKYMGDGLLAFFEPNLTPTDAAQRAVAAAHEMQAAFARLRGETAFETLGDLGLGIGISIGQVLVGNIGSEEVMNYTIVGDTVNVAARLQASAKAGQILLTQAAYELVQHNYGAVPVQALHVKGRRQPVSVYRLRSRGQDA